MVPVGGSGVDLRDSYHYISESNPWQEFRPKLPDPDATGRRATKMIRENGFVVVPQNAIFSLQFAAYETAAPYITSDSVLYVLGTLFRGGLAEYERQKLRPLLIDFVERGLQAARSDWSSHQGGPLAEPARRNLVLFGVAHVLLDGDPPQPVADEVGAIVDRIIEARATGFWPDEDYTIYRVRGSYENHPDLAGYFRATKWLGRYVMPLTRGSEPAEESDARLRQAALLGRMFQEDDDLHASWEAWREASADFIGPPDAITPQEVAEGADRALSPSWTSGARPELATDAALAALRAEFASDRYRAAQIAAVPQGNPGDLPERYCQVLGERYILDGDVTGQTVAPHVDHRMLPRGLDVAATVLGSDRAMAHLEDDFERYPDLRPQVEKLREQFGPGGDSAPATDGPIYNRWLNMLALLQEPAHEDAPELMQSDAWRDKQLNAALASWAWLRHDFVLYAKSPMTPGCASLPPELLVEPVPDFYAAAGAMARELARKGFPSTERLAQVCENLELVARAALGETGWLERDDLEQASRSVADFSSWLLYTIGVNVAWEDPTGVVDVHSDVNTQRILHVATGPLHPMIVEIDGPEGPERRLGYVLSYHEWQERDWHRMTDSEWRQRIRKGAHHSSRPGWTDSFMVH